jgi:hypothetical protein
MQLDEQVSPVPTLQQLRTLHPGALQHLQQSPDGQLYAHPHQALNQAVYHHPQQYALSGPPQPPPHALQYQHHGLPGSPVQFTAYPTTYQCTEPAVLHSERSGAAAGESDTPTTAAAPTSTTTSTHRATTVECTGFPATTGSTAGAWRYVDWDSGA